MKIAIIGYGKMGRMIESIARERGHAIGSCIDINNQDLMSAENLSVHDVAIELTTPDSAFSNISKCLDADLPVVSGTTGWSKGLDELVEKCRKKNGSFLYASNFSLGVNLLFHLNSYLAKIMNRYDQYDVSMKEVHHTQKLDAPSGTALSLAADILKEIERKKSWTLLDTEGGEESLEEVNEGGKLEGSAALLIEAIREGNVPGIHEIVYESDFDSLSLRHSAKDRRGFATGAVLAAEYIHNKKGFFSMKDVLELE